MIFLLAPTGELVAMFTEQDINNMRSGRTVFADERALKGQKFSKIIASVVKNETHAMELLRQSGHKINENQISKTRAQRTRGRLRRLQGHHAGPPAAGR